MHTLLSQDPDTWDAAVGRYRRRLKELDTVEAYAAALDSVGWTEGWSEDARAALRARLEDAWGRTPRHLYVYETLGALTFDTEGFDAEGMYPQLIERLAAATRGAFAPTEVTCERREDGDVAVIELSFAHGGETYSASFEQSDDWCKNEPFELLEAALEAAGVAERFVVLPTADQVLHACFVKPDAFAKALEDDLVPNAAVVI